MSEPIAARPNVVVSYTVQTRRAWAVHRAMVVAGLLASHGAVALAMWH